MRTYRRRKGTVLAVLLALSLIGGGLASPSYAWAEIPGVSTPATEEAPVIGRIDVDSCYGEECNGALPADICDAEEDREDQESVPVIDGEGKLLGVLSLLGNHEGCGSVQWADFVKDSAYTAPFTFEIRVLQDESGVSTEPVPWKEEDTSGTSLMIHSPVRKVSGQVFVFTSQGALIGTGATPFR